MTITLTPKYEQLIQQNATTRSKVDAAIVCLETNGGRDGETVINKLLDRSH